MNILYIFESAQFARNSFIRPIVTLNFNLPSSHLFRYYQLSHVFNAHFAQAKTIEQSILEMVLRSHRLEKPASRLYSHFITVSPPALEGLMARWLRDIPDLDNDDWDEVWDSPFRSLASLRDRLIQFKLVHRAYFTPTSQDEPYVFSRLLAVWCGSGRFHTHLLDLSIYFRVLDGGGGFAKFYFTCPHASLYVSVFVGFC